jgi:hypothetical protein
VAERFECRFDVGHEVNDLYLLREALRGVRRYLVARWPGTVAGEEATHRRLTSAEWGCCSAWDRAQGPEPARLRKVRPRP